MTSSPAAAIDRIAAAAGDAAQLSAATRLAIRHAYVDTLAVACAGWEEPVTRAVRASYSGSVPPWSDAASATDPEHLALVWGTAAHALDFDDVHMTSITHPSAVLFPALLAALRLEGAARERFAPAFALGVAVNMALGEALGFAHYAKGWHATSTIGAVAAGAAAGHLLGLDGSRFRSALAIAAASAGGLQRNFGTMTKPLQAGLAAQAGVRAARLAAAGVDGPDDVLGGGNGFLAAFEGKADAPFTLSADAALAGISRKLFPCCYMAHRPAAAAIDLHERIDKTALHDPATAVDVLVPPGCLKALTVDIPSTGAEAKFSGRYTVAFALINGMLDLTAFTAEKVADKRVLGLARRVSLRESEEAGAAGTGIDRGSVTVQISRRGSALARSTVQHYPGSPSWPMTESQLTDKLRDCVAAIDPQLAPAIEAQAGALTGS